MSDPLKNTLSLVSYFQTLKTWVKEILYQNPFGERKKGIGIVRHTE
jgi:hypothetical protein